MTYIRNKELEEAIFLDGLKLADAQVGAYRALIRTISQKPLADASQQALAGFTHRALDLHMTAMLLAQNHPCQTGARIALRALVETVAEVRWILAEDTDVRVHQFIRHQLALDKRLAEAVYQNERGTPYSIVSRRIVSAVLNTRTKHSAGEDFRATRQAAHWSGLGIEAVFDATGISDFYRFSYVSLSANVHSSWHDFIKNRLHRDGDGQVWLNDSVGEPLCVQLIHGIVFQSAILLPDLCTFFEFESAALQPQEMVVAAIREQIARHEKTMATERGEEWTQPHDNEPT